MDLSNEKECGSIYPTIRENPDLISPPDSNTNGSKSCSDCKTTKTPLWRGGPNGPKSLCNACGIRYRKKRREVKGMKMNVLGLKKKCKSRIFGEEEEQAAIVLMHLSSGLLYL